MYIAPTIVYTISDLICDLVQNSGLNEVTCSSNPVQYCVNGRPAVSVVTSCSNSNAVTGLKFSNLNIQLTTVFRDALKFLKLESLDISYSTFPNNEIPMFFTDLITVKTLILDHNGFDTTIPVSILFGMLSLKKLVLRLNIYIYYICIYIVFYIIYIL